MYIKAYTENNDIHSKGNNDADKLANKAIGFNECPYNLLEKIYLDVPFSKKEEIKKLCGKWDSEQKNGIFLIILSIFKLIYTFYHFIHFFH